MVPCLSRLFTRNAVLTGLIAVLLVVPGAAQRLGVDRHVSLEGARNFRDIGGYATSDGRRVRRGLLFRSDALAQLTESDYQALARLNIETVCDFRQDWEKQRAPTRWPGRNAPELLSLPNPAQAGPSYLELLANGATAADMAAYMLRGYETNVAEYAPSYAATLRRIVNSDRPVLYHCTAGKDRTGLFTALLLSFLGVPRSIYFQLIIIPYWTIVNKCYLLIIYAKRGALSPEYLRSELFIDMYIIMFCMITQLIELFLS